MVSQSRQNTVDKDEAPVAKLGTDISALFAEAGFEADVLELRGEELDPLCYAVSD
jgi:hypothetical protein